MTVDFVFLQDLQGHNKCRLFQQGMVQYYGMFHYYKSAVIFFIKPLLWRGGGLSPIFLSRLTCIHFAHCEMLVASPVNVVNYG